MGKCVELYFGSVNQRWPWYCGSKVVFSTKAPCYSPIDLRLLYSVKVGPGATYKDEQPSTLTVMPMVTLGHYWTTVFTLQSL